MPKVCEGAWTTKLVGRTKAKASRLGNGTHVLHMRSFKQTSEQLGVLLQIARQATSGPWLLRPAWRAAYWALTEVPARLEAMLPPSQAVPLTAYNHLPEQLHDAAECGWAFDGFANGTSKAIGAPVPSESSTERACALGEVTSRQPREPPT